MRDFVYPVVVRAILAAFMGLDLEFQVKGAENVPAEGGVLVAFNHVAYVDFILGGYGAWRRRLLRLGHISFFGIALLNLAFANTVSVAGAQTPVLAAWSLVAGAVLMPTICFLAAWRRGFRHLFFLPVLSLISGAVGLLAGGVLQ